MKIVAVITCAGSSARMKVKNKLLIEICDKPVIIWSLLPFQESSRINSIVVTAPDDQIETYGNLFNKYSMNKVVKIVKGGDTRQISVFNALSQIDNDCDLVAIHDGARCLLTGENLDELIEGAIKYGAVIPVVPANDTVKLVNEFGYVSSTPDRDRVVMVQTPQIFRFSVIKKANELAIKDKSICTDDSSLVERLQKVKVLSGRNDNIKITYREDMKFVESLLRHRIKEELA
jgi:2-C-methyl-D-erythritol 4-phosphate cytidylyltransferase